MVYPQRLKNLAFVGRRSLLPLKHPDDGQTNGNIYLTRAPLQRARSDGADSFLGSKQAKHRERGKPTSSGSLVHAHMDDDG